MPVQISKPSFHATKTSKMTKRSSAKKGPSETAISGLIRNYVNVHGLGYVWRSNTMQGRTDEGRFFKNGVKGSPDLVGFTLCHPTICKDSHNCGKFLGIEVKRDKAAKLSFYQKLFAKKVRETKLGIYIVARSIDDIWEKLENYDKEELPF